MWACNRIFEMEIFEGDADLEAAGPVNKSSEEERRSPAGNSDRRAGRR